MEKGWGAGCQVISNFSVLVILENLGSGVPL